MKHWVRDARYAYGGWNSVAWLYLMYHFLRTMGWEWLWECDGEVGPHDDNPNHCDDGNMEAVGTAQYTAQGAAVLNKVTTPVSTGTQAMEVVSTNGGDGIRTVPLLTMSSGLTYQVAIWAANNTGAAWDVEADDGSGVFNNIGTIPDNGGVATLYHFSFSCDPGINSRYVQVLDNNATAGTLYIDGILVFRSLYEFTGVVDGTDGIITNPDQFSTAGSYSFVVGDIGKFICVYDPTNFANSGMYDITAAAAGVATLNLRSATHAMISQGSLRWRMVDPAVAPVDTTGTYTAARSAGFGLQSPHSSSWRLFFRVTSPAGQTGKYNVNWSSPEDTDYDISSGNFWKTGPSTQNQRTPDWTYNVYPGYHLAQQPYQSVGTARLFMKLENEGDCLAVYVRDDAQSTNSVHFVIGYTGADADHPGIEEFLHASRFDNAAAYDGAECAWNKNPFGANWMGDATVYNPHGLSVKAGSSVEGNNAAGTSGAGINMSQAGPSPWSGEEWLRRVPIIRDPEGTDGSSSERDISIGVYQSRENLAECTPFDNDNYIHLKRGTVWDWMGESL